jgi:hypothetical protein
MLLEPGDFIIRDALIDLPAEGLFDEGFLYEGVHLPRTESYPSFEVCLWHLLSVCHAQTNDCLYSQMS